MASPSGQKIRIRLKAYDHEVIDRGGRQVVVSGGPRRSTIQSERPEGECRREDGNDQEMRIFCQRAALLEEAPHMDQCQQCENDSGGKEIRPHRSVLG